MTSEPLNQDTEIIKFPTIVETINFHHQSCLLKSLRNTLQERNTTMLIVNAIVLSQLVKIYILTIPLTLYCVSQIFGISNYIHNEIKDLHFKPILQLLLKYFFYVCFITCHMLIVAEFILNNNWYMIFSTVKSGMPKFAFDWVFADPLKDSFI